jgi:hypothetical protein
MQQQTANFVYRLSFVDQGKQTSVLRFPFTGNKRKFAVCVFCLHKTKRSCRFPLVPFSLCMSKRQHIYLYISISHISRSHISISHTYSYISIYICRCCHFKSKTEPRRFSLIRLLFADRTNRNLSFVRFLQRNKWKLSVCKRTERTKSTERTCPSVTVHMGVRTEKN